MTTLICARDVEDDKLTSDNGVAASKWRQQRQSDSLKTFLIGKWYVEWVEEIIELTIKAIV
jgi:hypothetical protein